MSPTSLYLGLLAVAVILLLAELGAIVHLARLLAQSQLAHATALERLMAVQVVGTPTLMPAKVIAGVREPEERISEQLEGAIAEDTVANGMVQLAQMYRERGAQVPRPADLRREVEQMLNGEVPRA